MSYINIPKPTSSVYTSVSKPTGASYTNISKPSGGSATQISVGMSVGLLIPLTISVAQSLSGSNGYTKIAKPS